MNRIWTRATKLLGTAAVVAAGIFSVGCGAYEPEPDVPRGYVPPPAPLTSEELAARQQAQASGSGDIAIGADADEYSDTDPSALTEWRPVLEPHGTWIDDPTYGTVWKPDPATVGADFQPYVTAGHWTYSDTTDWVWVSDYDWGWVPFHYGRWVSLPGHGWSWIPGRRYAGAWVTWRTGPSGYGYVGWAPAPPSWYWYHGVAVGWSFGFYSHHHHYVYCPRNYVYDPYVHTRVIRGPAAREHDARTTEHAPASSGSGGDRYLANPSVNGAGSGDRVVASPGVAGRVGASPVVARGPRPDEVGIKGDIIVPPPKAHVGLDRAQAFSSARSAIQQGAAPPAHTRISADAPSLAAATRPSPGAPLSPSSPFLDRPGSAPSVSSGSPGTSGVRPLPPRQAALPELRPNVGDRSVTSPGASAYRPSSPITASPSYRPSSPSSYTPPSYRSSPSVMAPRVSTPSYRPSSPSYSAPSFRSSPSVSAPRASAPSFRSSPSVSAPRVSPPSFRSSPSVSAPRMSSPSFRSSPSVSSPRSSAAGSIRSGGMRRR